MGNTHNSELKQCLLDLQDRQSNSAQPNSLWLTSPPQNNPVSEDDPEFMFGYRIGNGKATHKDNNNRNGQQTWYTAQELNELLARYQSDKQCEPPMPRNVRYSLEYAPSMWKFWASDPAKKSFRRKPFVLHGQGATNTAVDNTAMKLPVMQLPGVDEFLQKRAQYEQTRQPGHFNTVQFMGESGLVADALARSHRAYYSQLNSRPRSGPVVITQCN